MDKELELIANKWVSSPFLEKYRIAGENMDKAIRKYLLAKSRIETYKKDYSGKKGRVHK